MKIALLGCKGTTLDLLGVILQGGDFGIDEVVTLPPDLAERNHVAFYRGPEIAELAGANGIPVTTVRSYDLKNPDDQAHFESAGIDLLVTLGWERLVPEPVLKSLGRFAVGMHGSPFGLPRGRGRSPLNWSLITDQSRFVTYLFRYDSGVDSGAMLGSRTFEINAHDDIAALHMKNRISMYQLLITFVPLIERGEAPLTPQETSGVTYYPKRRASDGGIDWRHSTRDIYNLVRAVAPPYPAAFCFREGRKLSVLEAYPFDSSLFEVGIEPGTVVDVSRSLKSFVVKTTDGSLLVRGFEGVDVSEVTVGDRLEGVDQEAVMRDIVTRYPEGTRNDEKEISPRGGGRPTDPGEEVSHGR